MLGTSVEKLFERYRRKGDGEALARVFDRTSPELFRLAQHLVRDPLQAEDVLQETFVIAIDGAERWDASRPLVPWLTGILAKQASSLRRKGRRVIEADRLHERSEPDPADLAADSELSRELQVALGELPALYADVLRKHLLDGARPAEIASELERSPGTVRMQLHRGLELLRRSLPASFAAGAALAALSPRGLAAVREAVLAHASEVAVAGVAGTAFSAGLGLSLSKLGLGGLLAAASVLGIARLVQEPERSLGGARLEGERVAAPEDSSDEPRASAGTNAREPAGAADTRTPLGSEEEQSTARVQLVGRIHAPQGTSLAEARVEVRGVARYRWPQEETRSVRPRADGSYVLDLDPLFDHARRHGALSELSVRALHPHMASESVLVSPHEAHAVGASATPSLSFELRADLELRPAAFVHGRIVDASVPMRGAQVHLVALEDGRPRSETLDSATAGELGGFQLQLPGPGDYGVLVLPLGRRPEFMTFVAAPGRSVELGSVRTSAGRSLSGRVLDHGQPVATAQVILAWGERWVPPGNHVLLAGERYVWDGERLDPARHVLHTDSAGQFRVSGLGPGTWHVGVGQVASGVPYVARWSKQSRVLDGNQRHVELELDSLRVRVRALAEDGTALQARTLVLASETEVWESASIDGVLELALGEYRPRTLQVNASGFEQTAVSIEAAPGERAIEREVVLRPRDAGGSLGLQLASPGSALESVTVEWLGTGAAPKRFEVEGAWAQLSGIPHGVSSFRVHANGAWQHYEDGLVEARLEGVRAGSMMEELRFERGGRLRISVRDGLGAHLPAHCSVRELSGEPVDVRFLLRSPDEQAFSPDERLSSKGPSDVHPNLPAGVYEVEVRMSGQATRVLPVRLNAGEVSELDVVLP